MANKFPPLKPEGVQKLIDQLKRDLDEVQASSKVLQADKDVIAPRIPGLVSKLSEAIKKPEFLDPASPLSAGWAQEIAPLFQELTPPLAKALRLAHGRQLAADDEGACRYGDQCFQSTQAECQQAGGNFSSGSC